MDTDSDDDNLVVPDIVTTFHHSPSSATFNIRESVSPDINLIYSSTPDHLQPCTPRIMRSRKRSPLNDISCRKSSPANNRNRLSINPFTPTGINVLRNKHRKTRNDELNESFSVLCISPSDRSNCQGTSLSPNEPSIEDVTAKGDITNVSLYELQTSRFNEEFRMDYFIATGTFGDVYKCTNLMDGIAYAVKKTKKTIYNQEYLMRKEIYAHSVIGRHLHIVSYFTAWLENGHIYIQTELCNRGTLESMIHQSDKVFCDTALRRLLCHACKGLAHIHSKMLAHLDIKAANILISYTNNALLLAEDLTDDEIIDKDIVYKIGDFGHTVYVKNVQSIEEGDCRYLPKELLRDDYSQLQKADIFSLALTAYEAATKNDLPKNGPEWHALRDSKFVLPLTPVFSTSLERILKRMVDLNPSNRPSASIVVNLLLDRGMAAARRQQDEMKIWKLCSKFLASSDFC